MADVMCNGDGCENLIPDCLELCETCCAESLSAVQEERDRLKQELESLRSELARVSGERDKAVEALQQYANHNNWAPGFANKWGTVKDRHFEKFSGSHGYELAERTLREIEQPPTPVDKERRG